VRVLISAAEASSDMHGAQLLRALRKQSDKPIEAFGIGGPLLQAEGLEAIVDARELLAMGFSEVLARLPQILRALARVHLEAQRRRPELAIVIDYPEFHLKLANRLQADGVPVVYLIPPKVWVWRQGRVRKLKERFKLLLCILPFEEEFYRQRGVHAVYVGNPLVDELPLEMTREQARTTLGLAAADRVVVLMPGSRPAELNNHLEVFLQAALDTARRLQIKLTTLIPLPGTADHTGMAERVDVWKRSFDPAGILKIRVSQGDAHACLISADAGLIKSGTSTLEAGLLRCPHVVVYRPSKVSSWLFKNIARYQGPVGLVNLATGWKPGDSYRVREILSDEVTVENLSAELQSLLTDELKISRMRQEFEKLRSAVLTGMSPSDKAAACVLELARDLSRTKETT